MHILRWQECALVLSLTPQKWKRCKSCEHLNWNTWWLWEVRMKCGLNFLKWRRNFYRSFLLWCLRCCFCCLPLRGQWWIWELRVPNVASACTARDKIWAAVFLSSHFCELFLGGTTRNGVWPCTTHLSEFSFAAGGAPVSSKALCAVLMWQPILGSLCVINIPLQTAAPQDSPFWQHFQCRIVYSFLYQPGLLGPLSY